MMGSSVMDLLVSFPYDNITMQLREYLALEVWEWQIMCIVFFPAIYVINSITNGIFSHIVDI
ncbi:hypothetical protein BDQ94DRAFT_154096 [Aspergillus welwitschiae]|uniref:Uncharacterized protein n=1 Tax=Aspergillus welwitschiae TaxID=1341132 RepID=A0A3F3PKI3_9EURO|nr:hypothetical protein BDQ94DRAFT_154096 [Aspergillus welwitschiae]RDH27313.1 hypothetical protein BDQ94DRAFT_154096 [Aspergillus welwitschiae]